MKATSYNNINILLDSLLIKLKEVLGEKLIGFYLYGSLVWGDFDYDISDIDLLAVLSNDIDDKELILLKNMHDDFAGDNIEWDGRIEVQYFSKDGLKNFRTKSSKMANISPGEPLHIVKSGKEWLTNWYFVQDYGVTIFGPLPNTFIDLISTEEFVDAVKELAFAWREHVKDTLHFRSYQSYAILTMCRAIYTLNNKEQVSKKKAASWAGKEMPEYLWLIEDALKWRKDCSNKGIINEETYPITVEFVNYVIDRIYSEEKYTKV